MINSVLISTRLQLWDTAGQERFRKSMVAHYYRNVSAVVFVYDVTQKTSFDGLAHWIDVSSFALGFVVQLMCQPFLPINASYIVYIAAQMVGYR